ncbi:tail length tape measure protein [Klebsiella phage VLCpiS13e]|uniref:tail length tape measure protein n=1 Tax=Klebsiella phage VLCpiS13e TaxID=2874889 RepID=UPI00233E7600|nr:tail length tape measure protein [Klebsiella phage VLCpiS13e]UVX31601.1 tail length tape measure protein [Klebsiella phage VLCpiS13e]
MAEEVGGIVYEVGMEVSGLTAGAKQAEDALDSIDKSAQNSSKSMDRLDGAASSSGKELSALAKIVSSIDATLKDMASSSKTAASSVEATTSSVTGAEQVIAALNQQLAQMQQAQVSANATGLALQNSINQVTQAIRELGTQSNGTGDSISGIDRMIESLGNQIKILDEQAEKGARSAAILAAQLRAGDSATDAQKAKIAELTGRLYDMKNGTEVAGKSTGNFKNALQQSGYQIQDFVVQVQGGQSALVALSQQGSQLISVFGAGGAIAGALLTVSTVIAGSLIASLGNGKNAIDALKEAIATMDSVVSVSSSGVAVYTDKFAQLAKANSAVATLMRQQAQLELQAALSKVSAEVTKASSDFIGFGDSLVSSLGGGYASVKLFNDYMSQLNITTNSWTEAIKQASAAGQAGQTSMNGMIATVGALAGKFQLSDQQAFEFAKQLSDIAKNPSDEKLQSLVVTLQRVGEGTSSGAATAREYAKRLLEIATSSADATQRLRLLKQMTDELTDSQDKALQQAKQTLFIERQTGVEKQKALAWRDAENQGLKAGTQAFRDYYNVRLQTYQQQEKNAQALKDERSAQSAANSEAKKAATEQENIANKLEQLRQKSLLTAESTKELSRQQAILAAQQSLGKGATQEQINLAGQYAAKAWDNANALKAQAEAEKQRVEAVKGFAALKSQTSPMFAVETNYQKDLAALNAYAVAYPQKIAEVEQARAAIEEQYRQQRLDAMWQEWSQQNAATQAAAAAFDAFGQTASNALTGVLTGSMSVSEALQSIGSNVLNAVINSFVQMGVEWLKSVIMGQAGMAAASAATAAQAAGIAAAMAPAAAMTSLATGGANAVPAQAGIVSTVGVAKAMSVAGALKNGGPAQAGSMYQVGEGNAPEIFQASTGKQYMIPGDSGRVISNKDLTGGGSGIIIYNNVTNTSSGATTSSTARDNGDGSVTIETIVADIEAGGPISNAITSHTTATRRATE